MKNLIQRTVTGSVFVILVLGSMAYSPVPFFLLFLAFTILGLWEYFRVLSAKIRTGYSVVGLFAAAVVYISTGLYAMGVFHENILLVNLIIPVFLFVIAIFTDGNVSLEGVAITLLGIVYVAVPFALLNFFYDYEPSRDIYKPGILAGFFLVQWTYDICAYVGGRLAGRHSLFPSISPHKTWEGTIIGGLMAVCVSVLVAFYLVDMWYLSWIVIALIIIVFGTLGDLSESMIKRYTNVKDSGNIFPGHGGMLDRFDGVLFSAPAVLLYLSLIH